VKGMVTDGRRDAQPPTQGIVPVREQVAPRTPMIDSLRIDTPRESAATNLNSVLDRRRQLAEEDAALAKLEARAIETSVRKEMGAIDKDANVRAREATRALLGQLADHGFSWTSVAALANVSIPALRKWRLGGRTTGENQMRLARVVSLVHWLAESKSIGDVVGFLELPLSTGVPITRLDVLIAGGPELIVESLTGEETPAETILDRFQPDWRERYATDFEVVESSDGQRSIRAKP
jgi:hypothetical protein